MFARNSAGCYYTVGGGVHVDETSLAAIEGELLEETGEHLKTERPLCLLENFFEDNYCESLKGLNCHTVEYYYLVRCCERRKSKASCSDSNVRDAVVELLPTDSLEEYDIRPKQVVNLCKTLPENFGDLHHQKIIK